MKKIKNLKYLLFIFIHILSYKTNKEYIKKKKLI